MGSKYLFIMKQNCKFYISCLVLFFLFCNTVICQTDKRNEKILKADQYFSEVLNSIKICRWKYDAPTCVIFSFDDNYNSHKKIAQIFDQHGLKCTFFVITNGMLEEDLKAIFANGHEIGSHTFSHPYLPTIDSSTLEFQIGKAKEMIENSFGTKCVSFAEPGNQRSPLSTKIIFSHHLFIRNHSEYPEIKRIIFNSTSEQMVQLKSYLDSSIETGSSLQVSSHGLDGEGYMPITSESLEQALDLTKSYMEKYKIWVTTLKEGLCYENLYHEIKLEKSIIDDTLKLNFLGYNYDKYKDMENLPLSIEVPKDDFKNLSSQSDYTEIKEFPNKFIVTFDLKREQALALLINK